jgi:hypothetical protein
MPLGMCTWCRRSRLVQLHTWRSPRSGGDVCGEVCGHCFYGTGRTDDCRTCRFKKERAAASGQTGVRQFTLDAALQMFREQYARRRPR